VIGPKEGWRVMEKRKLTRRDFLRASAVATGAAVAAACAPATPQIVEVIKEVPVEKVVEKQVEVTVAPQVKPGVKPVVRWQTWGGDYRAGARQSSELFMEEHPDIDLIVEEPGCRPTSSTIGAYGSPSCTRWGSSWIYSPLWTRR
jgi:hypothetical protein